MLLAILLAPGKETGIFSRFERKGTFGTWGASIQNGTAPGHLGRILERDTTVEKPDFLVDTKSVSIGNAN